MAVYGMFSLDKAFSAIDIHTLHLLLWMMIVAVYLRIEGFLELVADKILSLSKSSWQVRWTEQALDLQGSPLTTTHWEAVLDTEVAPPTSDEAILTNPLGLYVTQLSWTEQRS